MSEMRFTLLGTGSSGGVPRVGGDWGACDPKEPRNYRTRCSALLERCDAETGTTRILIDTSPDLRVQLIDAQVKHLDALIYTHDHADQTHGIDDVRALVIAMRKPIPTYMDAATRLSLTHRFSYCFEGQGGYPAILNLQPDITPQKPIHITGPGGLVEMLPLDMQHGRIRSLGFRIGNLAYCNDVNALPEETFKQLYDLDTFIVDALRYSSHPTHAHLDQALAWIRELKPKTAILTNLHVDMDYQTLIGELPDGVVPGFDGMTIAINGK